MITENMFLPLHRSLFARKVKHSEPAEQRDPGWKLFGKVPPREGPTKDPRKIQKVETRRIEAFDWFMRGCEGKNEDPRLSLVWVFLNKFVPPSWTSL